MWTRGRQLFRRGSSVVVLCAVAAPLYADPVTVTSGLVRTELLQLGAVFTLQGSTFSWSSVGDFIAPIGTECSFCPSGTTTTLNGRLFVGPSSGHQLVWNGVDYSQMVDVVGNGSFTTGKVVVSGTGEFSLATPFQFRGVFDVFPHLGNDRLFTMNLMGSGTAVGLFSS